MGSIIRDLPILDLRTVSAEAISKIDRVENVRTVVLNPENAEAFMRVSRVDVRSHLVIKPEELLAIGQIEFNDKYLDDLPDNTRLVVLGHTFVDGFTVPLFLRKVQSMRIYGQVLYSHSKSVGALLSRLERLQGQLLEMPAHAIRWIGSTHLDASLLKSINSRPVASIGRITIDPRISVRDITENIGSMVQIGEIKGREETICALLSVCKRRLGSVSLS